MKKIMKLILSLLVAFTGLMFINKVDIKAKTDYQFYPLSCGDYEVGYVTDNGGFSNEGCYSDLNSAINRMYQLGNDGVVRHKNSYSPTKIIAMSSGVVVSYPMRSNSSTTNIYQYDNTSGKKTYVTKHREMAYFNTHSYDGNGNGKVKVNLTGFEGYIELKDVDLVPMKFVRNQLPLYLGGNDTTALNEQPFNTRIYQAFYEVKQNGNYKDLVFNAFSGWSKNGWPEKFVMTLGPAAEWMNVGSIYYSYNGYDFYSDREYNNKVNTYYNYYQFLPLRSKSNISEAAYNSLLSNKNIAGDSKLWNTGRIFIDNQNAYGVNAALVFAMACLESGYGTSRFAKEKNNLFGWNAFDSDSNQASTFPSISDGIREHMSINLRGFLDINDFRFFGMHLGNKGSGINVLYAADPYWGYKIAGIAYELDKVNNGYNGNLTDYNKTSLGLINKYNVSFYRGNNPSSGELYKSAYGATYQTNFIAPILADENNMVKVQSTNGIRDNGSLIVHKIDKSIQPGEYYNWDKSVGYLNKADVTPLNFTLENNVGKVPTGEFVFDITNISFKENKLLINGVSYMPGIYVNDENKAALKLSVLDEYLDDSKKKEISLTPILNENDKLTFNSEIDLRTFADGKYFFRVSTEYSKYSENNRSNDISDKYNIPGKLIIENKNYTLEKAFGVIMLNVKTNSQTEPTPEPSPTAEPTPTPTTVPVPTETPSPSVNPSGDYQYRVSLSNLKYKDELKNILVVEGTALIKGLNAGKDSEIKHQLIFTNMKSQEKVIFDLNSSTAEYPDDYNDGFEYSNILFSGEIDLAKLPIGEYNVKVQTQNGQITKNRFLTSSNKAYIPGNTVVGENFILIETVQRYNYRFEVYVGKNFVDKSLINKPTRRNSIILLDKLSLEDNSLNIKGVSWMFNVNYNVEDNAVFALKLLNTETGNMVESTVNTSKCIADYATDFKSKFNREYSCFDGIMDISSLEKGNYIVYLDNSTKTYRDIFEIYNLSSPKYEPVEINGKKYKLEYTKIHNRLELKVE